MKLGQFIEYNVRNIFLQKSCRKAGGLVPKPFLIFNKSSYELKAGCQYLSFNIFWQSPRLGHTKKTNNIKHVETCSIFNFLKKGMRLVPPPHFRHVFSRKMFFIYVLLRLSSLPKILGNMYILIIFSRFVTSSWLRITLAFFSNRFSTRPKTV